MTTPEPPRRPIRPFTRGWAALSCCALILLAVTACRPAQRGNVEPPGAPAPVQPPPVEEEVQAPAEPPSESPGPSLLEQIENGEALILSGQWRDAAGVFRQLLDEPSGDHLDRVLLRSALIRLHPQSPLRSPTTGYLLLERLIRERPQSFYAAEATLILDLRHAQRSLEGEVDRLREQLDELRRIDLEPPPGERR